MVRVGDGKNDIELGNKVSQSKTFPNFCREKPIINPTKLWGGKSPTLHPN